MNICKSCTHKSKMIDIKPCYDCKEGSNFEKKIESNEIIDKNLCKFCNCKSQDPKNSRCSTCIDGNEYQLRKSNWD